LGGDLAIQEYIAVGHVILGGRRRQGRAAEGMKFAILENRRGRAENEIGGPLKKTVLEILPAGGAVNRVLVPQEIAIGENGLVPGNVDGQGLADGPRAVLKADVGGVEPGRVHEKAGGVFRSKGHSGGRVNQSVVITVTEDRSRDAFADQRDVRFVAGQGQGRLLIGSVLHVDDGSGRAVVGNRVKSVLDVGVIPRSVLGNNDVIAGLGPARSNLEKSAEG
jgi:hypothetical protein